MREHVIDYSAISPILCRSRLKEQLYNISLINCHISTEESAEKEKDESYDALEKELNSCPQNDVKLLLGYLGMPKLVKKKYITQKLVN